MSVYPTIYLSVYLSNCLPVSILLCFPLCLTLFVCLSVCFCLIPFSFLSLCVSQSKISQLVQETCVDIHVCLSLLLSVFLSVSLCLSSEVNKDPIHTAPSLALQPHPSSPTTPPGVRCKLIEFPFWCKCWTISIIILCVHSLTRSHSSQEAIR